MRRAESLPILTRKDQSTVISREGMEVFKSDGPPLPLKRKQIENVRRVLCAPKKEHLLETVGRAKPSATGDKKQTAAGCSRGENHDYLAVMPALPPRRSHKWGDLPADVPSYEAPPPPLPPRTYKNRHQ